MSMPKKTGVTDNSSFFSMNRHVIRREHASSNSDTFKSIHQRKQRPCKDGSDYTTYKRRVALGRNYSDSTFGGSGFAFLLNMSNSNGGGGGGGGGGLTYSFTPGTNSYYADQNNTEPDSGKVWTFTATPQHDIPSQYLSSYGTSTFNIVNLVINGTTYTSCLFNLPAGGVLPARTLFTIFGDDVLDANVSPESLRSYSRPTLTPATFTQNQAYDVTISLV